MQIIFVGSYRGDECFWGEFYGYGGDAAEGDYYTLVVLDAEDATRDAGKGTIGYQDLSAFPFVCLLITEEDDAVVGMARHSEEIVHLAVGDGEDVRLVGTSRVGLHDVAEWFGFFLVHLQPGDVLLRGADEDEVVDGGQELPIASAVSLHPLILHGHESLNALRVEERLHPELPAVGYAHWEPLFCFSICSHLFGEEAGRQ